LTGVAAICDSTNSIRDVYWDSPTGVWYNGDYTMVVMSLLSRRKIHVHGVSKGPIQKRVEGKMVLSCPPQLSWEGKREWG